MDDDDVILTGEIQFESFSSFKYIRERGNFLVFEWFRNAFDNGGKPLSEGHRDKPSSKPEFFWLIIFIFLTSS